MHPSPEKKFWCAKKISIFLCLKFTSRNPSSVIHAIFPYRSSKVVVWEILDFLRILNCEFHASGEVFWVDLDEFPVPVVIFSSSDGSDPNHNGRVYSLFIEKGTGQAPFSTPRGQIAAELSFLRFWEKVMTHWGRKFVGWSLSLHWFRLPHFTLQMTRWCASFLFHRS